ncbi:MAG: aminotransferase class IV [Myxococcota bacterium]|nr:aminotransferase class IV [Myxococcota bacterium]
MAKFEGVQWGSAQLQYLLSEKSSALLPGRATAPTVTRSIHYGLFLVFEGIRFFVAEVDGQLEIRLLNWHLNRLRFQKGMAYSLGSDQQLMLPTDEELEHLLIEFLASKELRPFLKEMADSHAQGYLRPYTLDEEQSIGVTFPAKPAIRAALCRYDRYLGEPFEGVVVPQLVRAVRSNQTGCLKLGTNYLMSVKAVESARKLVPQASAALFLDDQCHLPLREREVTEWDSSCCLFAFRDGTIVKIPEGPLILPSVTIQGVTALARAKGITVEERPMTYGELLERTQSKELITVCSLGTAGILNRVHRLHMPDLEGNILEIHQADDTHPLYEIMGTLRNEYWNLYTQSETPPEPFVRSSYVLP